MNELEKNLTELVQQTVFIETFVDGRLTGKFSTFFFDWSYNKEENCIDLWVASSFIAANSNEISVDLEHNLITVNYRCVTSMKNE